ncbi:site-specific integrase [Eubacterium limosum]|uniref:site-specific integrase n=1 Tax=Eubacterium limosum TaxID=1736 RepID=UPI001062A3A8|nr:site-specific integrase [Eubacterium limosum]
MTELNNDMLFKEYLTFWMQTYSIPNNRDTTSQGYQYSIDKHIVPVLGNYKLKELSTAKIQEFINGLLPYKKWTIVSILKIIRNSLMIAKDTLHLLTESPCDKVFVPRTATISHITGLSDDEILQVLKDTEKKAYGIPIRLGYLSGMRAGEVSALSWDDVDFEKKVVYIRHGLTSLDKKHWRIGPPKTKTSIRELPMHEALYNFLKDLKQQHEKAEKKRGYHFYKINSDGYITACSKNESNIRFVCAKPDGSFTHPVCLATNCSRVAKRVGFRFTFHMLRHTYATQLLENQASVVDISNRLGHASTETTLDIYLHRTTKMAEATNQILDEKFIKIS